MRGGESRRASRRESMLSTVVAVSYNKRKEGEQPEKEKGQKKRQQRRAQGRREQGKNKKDVIERQKE